MGVADDMVRALGSGSEIVRARVTGVDATARLLVRAEGGETDWCCDALVTGDVSPAYELDETVLVLRTREGTSDGVILGRIGRASLATEDAPPLTAPEAAAVGSTHEKRVVIEADEELILRVGNSSIRIARDGKVVIRGEHVLTRARGTNRIKGGSVAIN